MARGFVLVGLLVLLAGWVQAAEERLTNQQVIDLVKAGLNKDLVMKKIKATNNLFDDSPTALIKLKKEGVPDEVIELMLDQADKQRKSLRSKINLEIQHLTPDNRPEVRDSAFMYLSRLGPAALPELRQRLSHTRPEIRAAVVTALGRLGDKESLRHIRIMLVDNIPEVRHAAAEALWRMKDELVVKLARDAVVNGAPPLSGYLRFLGYVRDAQSAPTIRVRLMENEDPDTRTQAAWALGEIGKADACKELEHALLKDRTAMVRREAATALGKLHIPETAKSLQRLCQYDNSEARVAALRALGEFPSEIVVPFLIQGALLQNNAKLNPRELDAVLASLRKLTHQDFGNDPQRWRLWWEKNRGTAGTKEEAGDLFPQEDPAAPPTPPPPPPLPSTTGETKPGQDQPTKEWLQPAAREKQRFQALPRHAREPGPAPKATPETTPKETAAESKQAIRSQDLPDMPPPILPPLPDKEEKPKQKAPAAETTEETPGALRAVEPPKDDVAPPVKQKVKTETKSPAADPPGVFVPEKLEDGRAPPPPSTDHSNDTAAMTAPADELPALDMAAEPRHGDADVLPEIPGVADIKRSEPRRKILLATSGREPAADRQGSTRRGREERSAEADPAAMAEAEIMALSKWEPEAKESTTPAPVSPPPPLPAASRKAESQAPPPPLPARETRPAAKPAVEAEAPASDPPVKVRLIPDSTSEEPVAKPARTTDVAEDPQAKAERKPFWRSLFGRRDKSDDSTPETPRASDTQSTNRATAPATPREPKLRFTADNYEQE